MPYSVGKQGNKYVVKKKSDGKIMGRHSTRKKALAQVAAIYANEATETEKIAMLMEAANLELVGRPVSAMHGALWVRGGYPYLIFQQASSIDLAEGELREVIIYFYGNQVLRQLATDPENHQPIEDDEVDVWGRDIDTWLNYDDGIVLIMPTISRRPNEASISRELDSNGYSPIDMPYYNNVDELIRAELR
jgi:hypothetical protein